MSQAVQNVECLGLALNLVVCFLLAGLGCDGLAPISFSSSGRGLTLCRVCYFPGPPFASDLKNKNQYYALRRWDVAAVEVLSSPFSVQWRSADEKPYAAMSQPS